MCAVDLNADGLSDLLVGAPMATGGAMEEGRVHVYINQGQVGAPRTLEFSPSCAAHVRVWNYELSLSAARV